MRAPVEPDRGSRAFALPPGACRGEHLPADAFAGEGGEASRHIGVAARIRLAQLAERDDVLQAEESPLSVGQQRLAYDGVDRPRRCGNNPSAGAVRLSAQLHRG